MQRSAEIFELNRDSEEALCSLEFLAYPLGASKQFAALRNTIDKAKCLLSNKTSAACISHFSMILYYAEGFGLECSREKTFAQRFAKPEAMSQSSNKGSRLDKTSLLIILLSTLLLAAITQYVVLKVAKHKWLAVLRRSGSVPLCLDYLEKLVLLELASGNHFKAEKYSQQSLKLATYWSPSKAMPI